MDLVLGVALVLLVAGVAATLVPLVPGGLLSLAGVVGYWWQTGDPGSLALAILVGLALVATAAELLGSLVAARASGAAWGTTAIATGIGLVALLVVGPVGLLVAFVGSIVVLEMTLNDSGLGDGLRTGLVTFAGVFASLATQIVLTAAVLVGFVLAVIV